MPCLPACTTGAHDYSCPHYAHPYLAPRNNIQPIITSKPSYEGDPPEDDSDLEAYLDIIDAALDGKNRLWNAQDASSMLEVTRRLRGNPIVHESYDSVFKSILERLRVIERHMAEILLDKDIED